jgi:hypothetical protein
MPEVKALKLKKDGMVKQPKLPFRSLPANSLHIGPSGSGKSLTLLQTLIQNDKLGGMFDKYLLFSPNIFVDPQYKALISYIEKLPGSKRRTFVSRILIQKKLRR